MTSSRQGDASDAAKAEMDALRAEVKRLADLVSELAKARSERATRSFQEQGFPEQGLQGGVDDAVDGARDQASAATEAFAAAGKQAVDDMSKTLEPLAAELSAKVERNPLSSLFIAAGVGLLVGILTRQGN